MQCCSLEMVSLHANQTAPIEMVNECSLCQGKEDGSSSIPLPRLDNSGLFPLR
jgi:hypothetical protein